MMGLHHPMWCFPAGGQWLPDVKQLAGGADEWQQPGDPPVRISWDQVWQGMTCLVRFSADSHSICSPA